MCYKESSPLAFDSKSSSSSLESTTNNITATISNTSTTNTNPTTDIRSKAQISVIVPIYNGADTASFTLANIKQVLNATFQSYEIIVVDDGSYDNTLEHLQREEKLDQRVKVLSYTPNMGKGYAVKKGITKSYGKIVLFIDADSEISPNLITKFIKALKDHDIVIGNRWHPSSKEFNVPFSRRRLLSKCFNLVVRIATGMNIKDTQAGLKAGNGDILRTIFKTVTVRRYAFDVELLGIANLLNLSIKEIPIPIHCKPEYSRLKISNIMQMVKDVAVVSYRARMTKWYQDKYYYYYYQSQKELERSNKRIKKTCKK
jgi:dolichyl-phosphate beta-glucosyltransferase